MLRDKVRDQANEIADLGYRVRWLTEDVHGGCAGRSVVDRLASLEQDLQRLLDFFDLESFVDPGKPPATMFRPKKHSHKRLR